MLPKMRTLLVALVLPALTAAHDDYPINPITAVAG